MDGNFYNCLYFSARNNVLQSFPHLFFLLIVSNYMFNMSLIKNPYILQMRKYNFHIYICHALTPAVAHDLLSPRFIY